MMVWTSKPKKIIQARPEMFISADILLRVNRHCDRLQFVTKSKLPGVRALVQGVHDLWEVFVDVDVKLLQGREVVELRTVGDGQLLHVYVQFLIRDLRKMSILWSSWWYFYCIFYPLSCNWRRLSKYCLSLTKRLIEPLGSPIFGVEITNSKYIECN